MNASGVFVVSVIRRTSPTLYDQQVALRDEIERGVDADPDRSALLGCGDAHRPALQ
jgi:hypothetical protein